MTRRFRRWPLAAATAVAVLFLAACGGATGSSGAGSAADADFVHKDARGQTIEIEGNPETVVAQVLEQS